MSRTKIVDVELERLVPSPHQTRRHSKSHIKELARSLDRFGFPLPILCLPSGQIVVGHARAEAAKLLKLHTVPVTYLNHLTEAEARAFAIAENRLGERGGWDSVALGAELRELCLILPDLDFSEFGFEFAELDILLDDDKCEVAASSAPPNRSLPAVTQRGDVWIIGRHRLACGDATLPADYELLMAEERAQMVFTDPPFNVSIARHVGGKGRVRHPEFPMASGEMDRVQFSRFLSESVSQLITFSVPGSIHYICIDHAHLDELTDATAGYTERKGVCVWVKNNAGMGSLYRSQHEFVFVFKSGKAPHINNIRLGKNGRSRSSVWKYRGANSFGATRDEHLNLHPTVKPLELVADAIKDCSKRDGIILDAFAGSGTTLVAAEQTGRIGRALELDPWYVDTAVGRLVAVVGEQARLAGCGTSFDEVQRARAGEAQR